MSSMTKREVWQMAKGAASDAARQAAKADGRGDDKAYKSWRAEYEKRLDQQRRAFNDYMNSDES